MFGLLVWCPFVRSEVDAVVGGGSVGQDPAREIGQAQARPGGQRVGGRDGDQERFGDQWLVVQDAIIERGEQECDVGAAVADRLGLSPTPPRTSSTGRDSCCSA